MTVGRMIEVPVMMKWILDSSILHVESVAMRAHIYYLVIADSQEDPATSS